MKTKVTRLTAKFGPENRFELSPVPAAPFRAWQENQLELLKSRLLAEKLGEVWDPDLNSSLRRAANEAAGLAWLTAYPLLVFPALFEEKTVTAMERAERQAQVRQLTRDFVAL